jgi:transketolase C-terminal domain/subunit
VAVGDTGTEGDAVIVAIGKVDVLVAMGVRVGATVGAANVLVKEGITVAVITGDTVLVAIGTVGIAGFSELPRKTVV